MALWNKGEGGSSSGGQATIPDGSIEVSKLSAAAIASLRQTPDDSISYPKLTPEAIAQLEDEINRFWGDWSAAHELSLNNPVAASLGLRIGTVGCGEDLITWNTAGYSAKTGTMLSAYPLVYCGLQCSDLPDLTSGTARGWLIFQDGDGRRWILPNANPEQPDAETWFYLNSAGTDWVAQNYNGDHVQQSLATLPKDGNWWPVESGVHGLPTANIFDDEPLLVRWTDNQQMVVRINYNTNDNTHEFFTSCREYEVNVFDGIEALGDAPEDNDLILIADDSDDGHQKSRPVSEFAHDISNINPDGYSNVFENYTFKSNGAVSGTGQVGWASAADYFAIIPKSGDADEVVRDIRMGLEFRITQKNDTTKWIGGVPKSIQVQAGNTRRVTVREIVTGTGGAPDNNASVDVSSLGASLYVGDIFHFGQMYSETNSFSMPSMEVFIKLLNLAAAPHGGIPAGRLYLYSRGSLNYTSSRGDMRNRAVDGNLLHGGTKDRINNYVEVGTTNTMNIPNSDNYLMYGKLRVEATHNFSYLQIRIPKTDDFTEVRFYRDEDLNTDLRGYPTNNGGVARDVAVNANNTASAEFDSYFRSNDNNSDTDPISQGDILWIEYFYIEETGGQTTTFEFRTNSSQLWKPLAYDSTGLKLAPTGDAAGWVNMVS